MDRATELYQRVKSDGLSAIDQFIASRQSEELFLDFKRSSDDGSGSSLHQIDRNNLAKAISGFGNSEGGILVWGVDCSRDPTGADVAKAKVPIADVHKFVSWLQGAVSGCTVPPHSTVEHFAVQEHGDSGYVVTLIPKSFSAPHQVVGRLQYFIRAGSDFVPTPHMVLAGMFGRANPPHVFHNYIIGPAKITGSSIEFQLGLVLCNEGPGIATDLHATLKCWRYPDQPSSLRFELGDKAAWAGNFAFGRICSAISQPGFRVPPDGQTQAIILTAQLCAPFDEGIEIHGIAGAGNSPPYRLQLGIEKDELEALYNEVMEKLQAGEDVSGLLREFPEKCMRFDEDEKRNA